MEVFLDQFQDLKHFELKEIKSITAKSDDNKVTREGGSGKVYSGVAFKRLNLISNSGQGNPKFVKEIFMLSRTHDDLISCVGFCSEDDEKVVVYEYEYHGSLDCHLNNMSVMLMQCLKIYFVVARGLCYLHGSKETHQRVIHRDIKSSNILMDENWNAKVSDMRL
ncbi:hypothetical protein LXL04_033190 [Taraxacum kok-saghyz]